MPPKLGLLSYVADAYLDGKSDDILLQPVSISFDQLHETAEYAAYARGGEKTPEGAEWLYKFIKAQGERNYGKIYVRFPEAVSMRQYLGEPGGLMAQDSAAKRLAMQKMAIEVAWRILAATPINATGAGLGAAADHPRQGADSVDSCITRCRTHWTIWSVSRRQSPTAPCDFAHPTVSARPSTRCPTGTP